MKKLTLTALLFSCYISATSAFSETAQFSTAEQDPKPTYYQLLLGGVINYHLANLDLSNNRSFRGMNLSTSHQLGGGVALNIQSSAKLFFKTGLFYEKRYAEDPAFVSLTANPHAAFFAVDLSYVTLPVMGGYFFANGKTRPYLAAGIHIGKGIQQKVTHEFASDAPLYVENTKPIIEFEGVEYGIIVEVGVQRQLKPKRFIDLSLRYTGTERTLSVNKFSAGGGGVNLGTHQVSVAVTYFFGW